MTDTKILLDTFGYSPGTGKFKWLINEPRNKKKKGDPAGRVFANRGCVVLQRRNNMIAAHNFAYLSVTGEMPNKRVWHKNGNTEDNRWCNLTLDKSKVHAIKPIHTGPDAGGKYYCDEVRHMPWVRVPSPTDNSPVWC